MLSMPLVLYPTTLFWVDDDELFLQATTEAFNENKIKTCLIPKDAINFFREYQPISTSIPLFRGCKEMEEYDFNDHMPVDINFNSILELRDNNNRTQEIGVLIIDYNMPGITGIELCRELQRLTIKKILLTGDANHQQAVDAFNEGIIHGFIRKDDPSLATDLLNQIKKLNLQYFCEMTKRLLSHLETDYKLPQSDPIYIAFFNEWCIDNKITEYYIIDKNGTLLTISENGHVQYFLTHTNRTLDIFTDMYSEDKEVSTFVNSVKQRQKIPFFGLKQEPWNVEFREWNDYFYSPKIMTGRETYYWTVIEDKSF